MDMGFNAKDIPKDARWQDLIPQLKCPQCQLYQASCVSNLERHVILHCKCRPALMKHHCIRKLKTLANQADEDVLEVVRLALEAKLLQWRKEGLPEIPLLLRQNETQQPSKRHQNNSPLLDMWRLWHQEIDCVNIDYNASELLQLMTEAENLDWDPLSEDIQHHPSFTQGDDQLNFELMSDISAKLKAIPSVKPEFVGSEGYIDSDLIERLEKEAFILSSLSK